MEDKLVFRFDGSDYDVWRAQMWALLESRDLAQVVIGKKSKITKKRRIQDKEDDKVEDKADDEDEEKAEKKAKSLLLLSLDRKIVRLVISCKTAAEVWDKLYGVYGQRSEIDQLVLMNRFYGLKMEPRENVSEYITRAEALKTQLEDAKVGNIDEAAIVGKIVAGLPPKFFNYMSTWSRGGSKLLKELLPQLMAEKSLITSFKSLTVANANYSEAKSNNRVRDKNDKKNFNKGKPKQNSEDKPRKPRDFSKVKCFNCD